MMATAELRGSRREGLRARRDGVSSGAHRRHRTGDGFTLIELIFATAVVAILAAIAQSQFAGYIERARVATAVADIAAMELEIQRFQQLPGGPLPASLADIGRAGFLDPWDRPYHYTNLKTSNKGKARKDRRLNPINSDYDLFSAGKNGVFKPQVSQKDSVDDIIRARDGAYIGLAEDF
jgi:general secretion pathway protein G